MKTAQKLRIAFLVIVLLAISVFSFWFGGTGIGIMGTIISGLIGFIFWILNKIFGKPRYNM